MSKSFDKPEKILTFKAKLPFLKEIPHRDRYEATFSSNEIHDFEEYQMEYDITLGKLADLQIETVDKISLLRSKVRGRRFGASISIDEETFWILDLISRTISLYDISENKKRRSSISGLVTKLVSETFTRPLIDTFYNDGRSIDNPSYSSAIHNLYKVCYTRNPDSYIEIFLPHLTYHVVPAFKAILLAVSKPEILEEEEIFLIATEFFDEYFKNDPLYPLDLGKRAILFAIDKNPIDFKEYFNRKINMEFSEIKKERLTFEERQAFYNLEILKNLSERDIDLFQERFDLVKDVMKKSGDLIKV